MAHGPTVWLPVAQFGATVFLGLGAFWLARRQWVTANEKLKLDLYERRDTILHDVLGDLYGVIQYGDISHINLGKTRYNLVRLKTFFSGATERYVDQLIAAFTPAVISYRRPSREERHDATLQDQQAEMERFWDLVLATTPLLQDSALADMKIRTSSYPAWISWAYKKVTLCLSRSSK